MDSNRSSCLFFLLLGSLPETDFLLLVFVDGALEAGNSFGIKVTNLAGI